MKVQMSKEEKPKFDLEERTAKFAEAIIKFAKKIPVNEVTRPLIGQLVKAGTSIGANYCEADCAETKKDFEHKMGICRKESKESRYWLRIIANAVPNLKDESRTLWQEANELNLIFSAIVRKSKNKIKELDI